MAIRTWQGKGKGFRGADLTLSLLVSGLTPVSPSQFAHQIPRPLIEQPPPFHITCPYVEQRGRLRKFSSSQLRSNCCHHYHVPEWIYLAAQASVESVIWAFFMPDPAAPIFDSMHVLATDRPHETRPDLTLPESRHYDNLSTSSSSDDLSAPKTSRRSLALLAKEKTSNVLTGLASISTTSNHSLRSAPSTGTLSKSSYQSHLTNGLRPTLPKSAASASDIPVHTPNKRASRHIGDLAQRSATPTGSAPRRAASKMHQTSSKILRMTDDDRPFTKDFNDLFATLVASLPLTPHRYRFTRIEETFTSEEAITNLGSLKFTQSNRVPDPKNPSRWVVTTTTTTFSMAKEMARSVCQRFLDARLIEIPDSRPV